MADPTKYTPSYDFSNWQASNPSKPLPGDRADIEFQNIDEAIAQTIDALKDVRRSDGALKNGIVTEDSLSATVSAAFADLVIGSLDPQAQAAVQAAIEARSPTWRGVWATDTAYTVNNLVREAGSSYICLVAHTSEVFTSDLTTGRWALFAQQGNAGPGTGDMLAANNLSDLADADISLGNLGLTATAAEINRLGEVLDLLDSAVHIWRRPLSEIPSGYQLCDGTNGTVDLRDKFIAGAGGSYAVGDTGGANSVTLTAAQMPAHSHGAGALATSSAGSHNHTLPFTGEPTNIGGGPTPTAVVGPGSTTGFDGAHTHSILGNTASAGSSGSHENRPPYYALCFIQKV